MAECRRSEQRQRLLSARVVMHFVLAMCLFSGQGLRGGRASSHAGSGARALLGQGVKGSHKRSDRVCAAAAGAGSAEVVVCPGCACRWGRPRGCGCLVSVAAAGGCGRDDVRSAGHGGERQVLSWMSGSFPLSEGTAVPVPIAPYPKPSGHPRQKERYDDHACDTTWMARTKTCPVDCTGPADRGDAGAHHDRHEPGAAGGRREAAAGGQARLGGPADHRAPHRDRRVSGGVRGAL
ncbi:transposase domain-containing protein [Streptomyces sp. NPDC059876]|uniref:transposase domain-containing protein n=1 Tax=unclassified Streptomyces TaxID=2593676 RepID=UPI0036471F34